jgi:AraC-like DNA-binding protein
MLLERERRMSALLLRLAPHEGYTQSLLDGVRFLRSDRPVARTPVLYEPSIVIVCQGLKRGYLDGQVYRYDAQHYLVLSVPLPFSSETDASPEHPMLAVSIRLDMTAVADLVMALAEAGKYPAAPPQGIVSTPLDEPLQDATLRLLDALSSPLEAKVLAPAIVREMCYRVLIGEQGGAIRAALGQQGHFGRVSRVLRRIHVDYSQQLDVSGMARDAGLSVAAFHTYFKTVTRTSPIQYIKSIRLHQARLMMIRDRLTAAAASARVGYESPSQFNREFKRLFGRSPGEEARCMAVAFSLFPAVELRAEGEAGRSG